jgi:hypothetical protein
VPGPETRSGNGKDPRPYRGSRHGCPARSSLPLDAKADRVNDLAEQLQRDLGRVGIARPQLFERSKVRQPLRAHDLRATLVTISLATGKSDRWIMDRTGHRSIDMLNRYRRKGRTWNLGALGPMCYLIPELREVTQQRNRIPPQNPQKAPRRWRNWQTRWIQVPVPQGVRVQLPSCALLRSYGSTLVLHVIPCSRIFPQARGVGRRARARRARGRGFLAVALDAITPRCP